MWRCVLLRPRRLLAEPFLHHIENAHQLVLLDHIGRHGVHILQEGAAEYAALVGKLLEALQIRLVIHLHAGAAAHDPNLFDTGVGKAQHFPLGDGFNAGDLGHIVLPLKDLDALQGGGAGQSVAHKSGTVHQGLAVVIAVKSIIHLVVGHSGGMANVAAGEGLAQHQNIRQHHIGHKAVARAAKVDRRVVRSTIKRIENTPELLALYSKLKSMLLLSEASPEIGCSSIEVVPTDATMPGIMAGIMDVLYRAGINVRQAVVSDPVDDKDSHLIIVTDGTLPGSVLSAVRSCRGVASIIIK